MTRTQNTYHYDIYILYAHVYVYDNHIYATYVNDLGLPLS